MIIRCGYRGKKFTFTEWGKLGQLQQAEEQKKVRDTGHMFILADEEPTDQEINSGKKAGKEKGNYNSYFFYFNYKQLFIFIII